MARQIYSTRFYAIPGSLAGIATIFTVPIGSVYVVRDIDVVLTLAGANTIGFFDTGAGSYFFYTSLSAGFARDEWRGRAVYEPGDSLHVITGAVGWNGQVSGYVLTA